MEFGNRLAAAVLDGVGHCKQAQHVLLVSQKNDRLALLLQLRQTCLKLVRTLAQLVNQAVIAYVVGLAVNDAFGAASGQCFKALDVAQRHRVAFGRVGQGA